MAAELMPISGGEEALVAEELLGVRGPDMLFQHVLIGCRVLAEAAALVVGPLLVPGERFGQRGGKATFITGESRLLLEFADEGHQVGEGYLQIFPKLLLVLHFQAG